MNAFFLLVAILVLVAGGFAAYYFTRPRSRPKIQNLYTDALSAIIKSDYERAVDLLRTVVRNDSRHVEAYMHLGDVLREMNQARKALKIHQSLTVRPDLPKRFLLEIHRSLVLDYARLLDNQRATREAEQILKIDRKNRWATEYLLNTAREEGRWNRALQLTKAVQRLEGRVDVDQLAAIKVSEGRALLARQKPKEALAVFNKAVKIAPDFGQPYFEIGELYYQTGDLKNAVKFWERYATCCPEESTRVYTKVETALFESGLFSEAENFYRRLLKQDGTPLEATVRLANVLVEKGDQRSAVNLVEESLAKSPDSLPARLLKLKLSLTTDNPHQLGRQIDQLLELIHTATKEK